MYLSYSFKHCTNFHLSLFHIIPEFHNNLKFVEQLFETLNILIKKERYKISKHHLRYSSKMLDSIITIIFFFILFFIPYF